MEPRFPKEKQEDSEKRKTNSSKQLQRYKNLLKPNSPMRTFERKRENHTSPNRTASKSKEIQRGISSEKAKDQSQITLGKSQESFWAKAVVKRDTQTSTREPNHQVFWKRRAANHDRGPSPSSQTNANHLSFQILKNKEKPKWDSKLNKNLSVEIQKEQQKWSKIAQNSRKMPITFEEIIKKPTLDLESPMNKTKDMRKALSPSSRIQSRISKEIKEKIDRRIKEAHQNISRLSSRETLRNLKKTKAVKEEFTKEKEQNEPKRKEELKREATQQSKTPKNKFGRTQNDSKSPKSGTMDKGKPRVDSGISKRRIFHELVVKMLEGSIIGNENNKNKSMDCGSTMTTETKEGIQRPGGLLEKTAPNQSSGNEASALDQFVTKVFMGASPFKKTKRASPSKKQFSLFSKSLDAASIDFDPNEESNLDLANQQENNGDMGNEEDSFDCFQVNIPSGFDYYMPSLLSALQREPGEDKEADLFREHFFQTFQSLHFCKKLKPIDSEAIGLKREFMPRKTEDKSNSFPKKEP